MRFYTSLALGLLAVASGACSSGDDAEENSPSMVPFLGSNPSSAREGDSQNGASPEMGASSDTVPGESTESDMLVDTEGGTMVTQVAMNQPAVEDGQGGQQDTATEETPVDETTETDPVDVPEAEPAASTQVYLLFGQSNMWGVPNPQNEDMEINERVEVLTLSGCNRHGVDQWVPAQPPLHGCVGQIGTGTNGPGVGPGDYFAKTLADAFPADTILLVPNAIPSESIDTFQPGQAAYNSIVARARMAQERGEIRGMIFHQGETDTNQGTWPGRVKTVVDQLRADLGTGDVPFIAGELLIGGCCDSHNALVAQLTNDITNTSVASAAGFTPLADDGFGNLHFDLPSQREFGRRYGQLMLEALGL